MRSLSLLLATTILALPVAWAETSSTQPTEDVSTSTPQPFIIPNEARTLEETLRLAESHPLIAARQYSVEQASGTLRAARGARWFTLSGDAEAGIQAYDDEDDSGSAAVGNLGLGFNQPLLDGGRRRGAVYSAEQRVSAATENLAWQKRLRRYSAAAAHINLWLAQELVRNNSDNVSHLEAILTDVRGRMGNAEATVTEVAEAESRLASARAAHAERLTALSSAQATYVRDVGEDTSRVASPGEGLPVGTPVGLQPHPLIVSARYAVQEAEGLIRQRKSAYAPTLDLRGRASHNAFAGTTREEDASQGQLTLNLGYTFLDSGVRSGETAAARAARKTAEAELANTTLEVEAARLAAQGTFTEATRRLEESARARTENANVIQHLAQEVRNGNRTVRELLDARRDQLAAANAWSQAYANRVLSTYDVERWQ
ncbi:MAG: TolC family protein [Rubrivivax sp.]|nr:MAG: TolC family protein [Rubrivivax sp.]